MGIWITPETCKLRSSFTEPIFGATAFNSLSSRMSQPTETHRTVPVGSNDDRKAQDGRGWALSSHSTMTSGQEVTWPLHS